MWEPGKTSPFSGLTAVNTSVYGVGKERTRAGREKESGKRERDGGRVKFQLSLTFPKKNFVLAGRRKRCKKSIPFHRTSLLYFQSDPNSLCKGRFSRSASSFDAFRKNDFYFLFFLFRSFAGSGVFVVLSSPQDGVNAWRSTCTGFHSFLVFFFA